MGLKQTKENKAELNRLSGCPCQGGLAIYLEWLCRVGVFISVLLFSSIAQAQIAIDLQAIKTIESSSNPLAFNPRTRCYGLYQISEICLRDFNQINKTNYKPEDLFNPLINQLVASWYFERVHQLLDSYSIPVSLTTLLASYNWGIGNVLSWHRNGARFEELPQETRQYIKRYLKLAQKTSGKQEGVLPYQPLFSYSCIELLSHSPQIDPLSLNCPQLSLP